MRRFPGDGRTCPRPSDWARSYDIVILAARCMRDLPSPALCDCQPPLDSQSTISSACLPGNAGLNLALRLRATPQSSANQRTSFGQVGDPLSRWHMVMQMSTDLMVVPDEVVGQGLPRHSWTTSQAA
jgi:hypothetical protein